MESIKKYNIYGVNRKYESDYGRNIDHKIGIPEQPKKEVVVTPITKKFVKTDTGIYAVEKLSLESRERIEREKFTESDNIETLFDFYAVEDGDDIGTFHNKALALNTRGICWGMAETVEGWKNIAWYNKETKEWVLL